MRRLICILLFLSLALLTACTKEKPPVVRVVHDGQLYEVTGYPDVTTGCGRLDESKMIDATIIPAEAMPTNEGEVNVRASSVQIYDFNERMFLVIIDGEQYIVDR